MIEFEETFNFLPQKTFLTGMIHRENGSFYYEKEMFKSVVKSQRKYNLETILRFLRIDRSFLRG